MSCKSISNSQACVIGDFTRIPSEHIELDNKANLILSVRIIAEIIFTESEASKYSYDFTCLETSLSFNDALTDTVKEVPRRIIQVISGPIKQSKMELESFISSYKIRKLRNYQEVIKQKNIEIIPPERPSAQLKQQVISHLTENNIFYSDDSIINTLLILFSQAIKAHKIDTSKIVCISSKSPALAHINSRVDIANASEKYRQHPKIKARASVRVFPNGLASITLPGLKVIKGGTKIIKQELTIDSDGSIKLMRRYKIQKTFREKLFYEIFLKNIQKTIEIDTDKILTPKLAYLNTKKLIEYLAKDCQMDLFELLHSYYIESKNPLLIELHSLPIEKHAAELLRMMISCAISLRQLHKYLFLHNDIKPENYLLEYRNKKFQICLCDLEFICNIKEGSGSAKYLGSDLYVKKGAMTKTISTDIYALGRTFFLNIKSKRNAICFVFALETLKKRQVQQFGEKCGLKMDNLIENVKQLSLDMQTKSDQNILDAVILKLSKLRALLFDNPLPHYFSKNVSLERMRKRNNKTHKRSLSMWI